MVVIIISVNHILVVFVYPNMLYLSHRWAIIG